MIRQNYHTHSSFCDGTRIPEDYIHEALTQQMNTLGFSSHAPLSFHTDWTMKPERLPDYQSKISHLKQKYQATIRIYLGLEIDYTAQLDCLPYTFPPSLKLDYRIGSIHFLGKNREGVYWTIDGSLDELIQGLADNFDSRIRRAVERYYELILEMAYQTHPDIIGHLDLIKKNNTHQRFFDPEEKWYRDLTEYTIRQLARSDCLVEVNTGGIARKRCPELYPSPWLLKQGLKAGLRIVVNSDAHRPHEIAGYFPEALSILREIGFRELWELQPANPDYCSVTVKLPEKVPLEQKMQPLTTKPWVHGEALIGDTPELPITEKFPVKEDSTRLKESNARGHWTSYSI